MNDEGGGRACIEILRGAEGVVGAADGAGLGHGLGVGDGEVPLGDAHFGGEAGGFAGEFEDGAAEGVVENFHIGPGHGAAEAGAEDFDDGFLGGEASGEVLHGVAVFEAVFLLGGGEAAIEEMGAVVGVHPCDAVDFRQIDTVSDDTHGGQVNMARRGCKQKVSPRHKDMGMGGRSDRI